MPTSRAPRILLLVVLLTGLMMAGLARAEQSVVTAFGDSITTGYPYWTGTDGNGCLPSGECDQGEGGPEHQLASPRREEGEWLGGDGRGLRGVGRPGEGHRDAPRASAGQPRTVNPR